MFNHFEEDSAVKVFLKNNCTHLLKAPTHDTGVFTNYFYLSNWNITNKKQLPAKASHSLFKSWFTGPLKLVYILFFQCLLINFI